MPDMAFKPWSNIIMKGALRHSIFLVRPARNAFGQIRETINVYIEAVIIVPSQCILHGRWVFRGSEKVLIKSIVTIAAGSSVSKSQSIAGGLALELPILVDLLHSILYALLKFFEQSKCTKVRI